MRIAILGSRGFPSTYGGFETFVRRLAPFLVDKGHEVIVYCREPGVSLRWSSGSSAGVRQIRTPGWDRKALSTLSFGATSSLDVSMRRVDTVLVLNVANGFYLPFLRRFTGKAVVNVDGLEWERGKWNGLGKSVLRAGALFTARFADDLVFDSQAIQRIWSSRFRCTGTFIPYGADLIYDRPPHRIRALGVEPKSYGLVVARLTPENNVELILDAIERLDPDLPFVIVGSANYLSPLTARLELFAERRSHFVWLGHVDDQELLLDLWFNCAVYIHGHSVGGTNPALLQALGCGAPTLALDTPYNREVVREEAMLFGMDPENLADRIDHLLRNDPPAWPSRSIIEERYQWESCCSSYMRLLTDHAALEERVS